MAFLSTLVGLLHVLLLVSYIPTVVTKNCFYEEQLFSVVEKQHAAHKKKW